MRYNGLKETRCMKVKRIKKAITTLLFFIFFAIAAYSAWKLFGIHEEYEEGTDLYEQLAEQFVIPASEYADRNGADSTSEGGESAEEPTKSVEEVLGAVDFQALKQMCDDVVGWIYCPGTPINYPIVQAEDNDYYLYRLINGKENKSGTLFMDFRNSSDFSDWNTLIYGHNMNNDSMFGVVPDYVKQEFYEKHPLWYLLTEDNSYVIELVGGYVTPADSEAYALPTDQAGRDLLYQKASRSSTFQSNVSVSGDDVLITCSTCVYDYENARYVLVGVLREMGNSAESK